jgi:hypoxanthine-DNA glycosylase
VSVKQGLPPVAGPETRLLILGSLPGDASLAMRQYYGHPRNQFWRLMGAVLEEPLEASGYDERLARLASRGIGLWDVVARAHRPGSLDAAMSEIAANELDAFTRTLPKLQAVAFNGGAAARIGIGQLAGREDLALVALPSSSPAHAGMTFEAKAARWAALSPFVPPPP